MTSQQAMPLELRRDEPRARGDGPPERLVDVDRQRARFRVHRSAYKSREVFEQEKKLIFDKCWLYVGHRTEIPKAGDFVTRRIGGRDIIFARNRKEEVVAYFNACTHRGAAVCRETHGNARVFTCPYHGWTFDTAGKLVSTFMSEGYRKDLNEDRRLDLPRPALLEHYRGFYFLNYNPRAISLADYLAGAKDVIDSYCDQAADGDQGLYVVGGEHAYSIRANYKYLAENSYDGYHVVPTHTSYIEYLAARAKGTADEAVVAGTAAGFRGRGSARGVGHGHAMLASFVPSGRPVAHWLEVWGPKVKREIDANYARLVSNYGQERADYLAKMQKNLVIFPNLVFNDNVGLTLRVIEPTSAGTMTVRAWGMAHKGEAPELTAIRIDNFSNFLGPAGFGSADDIEMLELCQEGIEHAPTEWTELSKGMDVNAPDLRVQEGAPDDECQMQAYWTQWDRVMRGIDGFERPEGK
jgi:p-cumate 2,3-dioxygenase subunit alpha